MNVAMIQVLCITGLLVALVVFNFWRLDLIALVILVLLAVFDLVPQSQIFHGFASDAVVSIIAVMIIGAGLERTGLMASVAKQALRLSHRQPKRLLCVLSLISGVMAGLLRSVGGFALMMPVITRVSIYTRVSKKKLLMPVGFSAIVGGTLTLLGSGPLLVLNDLIANRNASDLEWSMQSLGVFTVTPIGLALLITVILFFVLAGDILLPGDNERAKHIGTDIKHFKKTYGFGGRIFEANVRAISTLKGVCLSDLEVILQSYGLAIVGLASSKGVDVPALRKRRLQQGYRVALVGKEEKVRAFAEEYGLRVFDRLSAFEDVLNPMCSGFSEIVIPPGSPLIGQSMNSLHMKRKYGVQVLSLYRGQPIVGEEMQKTTIRSGDTLGLFSQWKNLSGLAKQTDFVVATTDYPDEVYHHQKRHVALFCLFASLCLSLMGIVAMPIGLFIGAVGMLMSGVLTTEEAYRAVSWRTVMMMAGLIPLGFAMQSTGTADLVAKTFIYLTGALSINTTLLSLSILASIFGLLMSNVGATVVLVPIAFELAGLTGGDPRLFAIVTAIATSNAFLIPTHQVNALIAGPGGYENRDFVRVGLFVSVLHVVVLIFVARLFFG